MNILIRLKTVRTMDNIIFRKSWFKTLSRWNSEQKDQFITALGNILLDLPVNITDERVMDLWEQVLPLVESDMLRYSNKVKANQENGKLGGRPKKPNETQDNPIGYSENPKNPSGYFENPKNLKDKDKDKERDKDIDKDNNINKLNNIIRTNILGEKSEAVKFYNQYRKEIELIRDTSNCSLDDAINIHFEIIQSEVFG